MTRYAWALLIGLTLTGCHASITSTPSSFHAQTTEQDYHLKDGRTVHCLIFVTAYPSLSCDWNNAR